MSMDKNGAERWVASYTIVKYLSKRILFIITVYHNILGIITAI